MISSMSRKGNCWDNAVTATPFGSLKVERLAKGQAAPWPALRRATPGQGRGDGLDRLLQPSTASFDAGLYQPDGLRTKMAYPATEHDSIAATSRETCNEGKVKRHHHQGHDRNDR